MALGSVVQVSIKTPGGLKAYSNLIYLLKNIFNYSAKRPFFFFDSLFMCSLGSSIDTSF